MYGKIEASFKKKEESMWYACAHMDPRHLGKEYIKELCEILWLPPSVYMEKSTFCNLYFLCLLDFIEVQFTCSTMSKS